MNRNYNLKNIIENDSFSKIRCFINKYENKIKNIDNKEKPIKLTSKEKRKINIWLIIPFSILNILILQKVESYFIIFFFAVISILFQIITNISIIKIKEDINNLEFEKDMKSFKNPKFLVKNTGYFKNKEVLREIRTDYLILSKECKEIFEDYLNFKKQKEKSQKDFFKNIFIFQLNEKTNHKYIFDNQKKVIDFIKENFLDYPDYTKECLAIIKEAIKNYQEFSKDIESEIKEIEKIKEDKVNLAKGIIRNI